MSVLEMLSVGPISESELKAPEGRYRVVISLRPDDGPDATHFLVQDFTQREAALFCWRTLLAEKRSEPAQDMRVTIYDDHGRTTDAMGTVITEEERKAPPGMFRVICGDALTGTVRLVRDMDDADNAIDFALTSDGGPYIAYQVHDDTGNTLIPLS